mgnify:CR=1 FL=1
MESGEGIESLPWGGNRPKGAAGVESGEGIESRFPSRLLHDIGKVESGEGIERRCGREAIKPAEASCGIR